MSGPTTPQPGPVSRLVALLGDLEDGALLVDADRELTQLVAALGEHQQNTRRDAKGRLTITIDFKDDGSVVEAAAGIATKTPKPIRGRSILFRGRGNTLSRSNPEQMDLLPGERPKSHLASL